MPSFEKVSKSFGIKYLKIKNYNSFLKTKKSLSILRVLLVCEIIVDENQESLFKQGYKSNNDGTFSPQPLSEMHPFLSMPVANTNN